MAVTSTTILSTVTLIKDSMMNPFIPVEASDGTPPYSFSINPGLPSGLSINIATGDISGTPSQLANLVDYDITVTDSVSSSTTSSFQLTVQSEIVSYLERIATASETVATASRTVATASTTTGVRMVGPYDWLKPTEVYSWYNQDLNLLRPSTATIGTIVIDVNTITNNMPKFL